MKLLVDSNIIIDSINGNSEFDEILVTNLVYTCGLIKNEVLIGAKNDNEFNKLNKSFSNFEYIKFNEEYWDELSLFRYELKKNGIIVPFQDSIIAFLSIKNDCSLLTRDKHFELIKKVYPNLDLLKK